MSFQACFWFVYLWNFRNLWWQPSFQVEVVAICSGTTLVTCNFTPFSTLGFQLLFSDISPLKSRMRFPYCCLERPGERKLVGNVQVLLVVVPFILALLQNLLSFSIPPRHCRHPIPSTPYDPEDTSSTLYVLADTKTLGHSIH